MIISQDPHMINKTSDLHIVETSPLVPPTLLRNDFALDQQAAETVANARQRIQGILSGEDHRL